MKKIFLLALVFAAMAEAEACTNLLVGKKASADGSVMVSYNADSYGMYGFLCHYPAGKHKADEIRDIYDWDTGKYLGHIPEAAETYNVIGNMNEYQVSICETTFEGREELIDTTGVSVMDYGSLIYVALQRSKTAREAIKVMTQLVEKYGYASSGESFSIADKNEIWVMEMIGKGAEKGAVWVAVRIPDDAICAHANQSRIHQFLQYDKKDCMYSKDVISFARKRGYFKGKDKDFSFSAAYAPADFSALRFCEARVWSFFHKYSNDGMMDYLDYAKGDASKAPMPLYIVPNCLLSVKDVQEGMRDHYENTPLLLTDDMGCGAYEMPYRPGPLVFQVDSVKYFNERPISTQQTAFTLVSQLRSWLPDAIGGVEWFGTDDATFVAYVPVYGCTNRVPECFSNKTANDSTFSWKSSFWVCNWIANMTYPRYSMLYPEVEKERNAIEQEFFGLQEKTEVEAEKLYLESPEKAVAYLTDYTDRSAQMMFSRWKQLGERLIVQFNDMGERVNGKFRRTGFPQRFRKEYVKATGDKYKMP
jgi:dipeptidase